MLDVEAPAEYTDTGGGGGGHGGLGASGGLVVRTIPDPIDRITSVGDED